MPVELEQPKAVDKVEVFSLDYHLMNDVLTYGAQFNIIADPEATDDERVAAAQFLQSLEKDKLPVMFQEARNYHVNMSLVNELIDSKIKGLQTIKASVENALKRHDDNVRTIMTTAGIKKVPLVVGSLTVRVASYHVEIDDERSVPSTCKTFTIKLAGPLGKRLADKVKRQYEGAEVTATVSKTKVKDEMHIQEKIVGKAKFREATKHVPGARLALGTESLLVQ